MIAAAQQDYIEDRAYVPEHIPHYVTAISQTEPYLFGDFLVYAKKGHLILVGYPLKEPFEEKRLQSALEDAIKSFKPDTVSLTAPSVPSSLRDCSHFPSDHYYRLDLSSLSISQKLRNMLKRASRELSVEKNKNFSEEHRKMVQEFLKVHPVDEATRSIFQRIDKYLSSSKAAWIFDVRDKGNELVAFDVAEFQSRSYCFYMFNFTSDVRYVPGVSDLLLFEVIQQAKKEGKKYINLGLGINPGVTFFKKKWGGMPFLPHAFCLFHPSKKESLETLLQKL
jgi:hypothetical protein